MLAAVTALCVAFSAPARPLTEASRYVATNRFRVRSGREAAFEKRWADRKSRLGLLDGFRYFCMLRKVDGFAGDEAAADKSAPNYISTTVWEQQDKYEAWRAGDAFKEAHGGGTIRGIASMMLATARNTKGKPTPAMWDGLMPESAVATATTPDAPAAWAEVQADGVAMLPAEGFVAMNRFCVTEGNEEGFERRFASRETSLRQYRGFKGFLLLRRDGDADDGCNYSTFSVWEDRDAFAGWRDAQKAKPKSQPQKPAGGGGMYARPPTPSFYEAILQLETSKGV